MQCRLPKCKSVSLLTAHEDGCNGIGSGMTTHRLLRSSLLLHLFQRRFLHMAAGDPCHAKTSEWKTGCVCRELQSTQTGHSTARLRQREVQSALPRHLHGTHDDTVSYCGLERAAKAQTAGHAIAYPTSETEPQRQHPVTGLPERRNIRTLRGASPALRWPAAAETSES